MKDKQSNLEGFASSAKVIGETDSAGGIGLYGHTTSTSGPTYGVVGETDASDGYGLHTPGDASVGGTTETSAVGGSVTGGTAVSDLVGRALSINSNTLGFSGPAEWGNVGATSANAASGTATTVAGGVNNEATGKYATVPGGQQNTASGDHATAAGQAAGADSANAFVWNDGAAYHDTDNDGTEDGFAASEPVTGELATGAETFNVSARGGARIVTGSSSATYIESGSTGWSAASSSETKTDEQPVDPGEVLDGVQSLNIQKWRYRDTPVKGRGPMHIGPMAEDWHSAFDIGGSDKHINSVNADGVAFAAIQALASRVEELERRVKQAEDGN